MSCCKLILQILLLPPSSKVIFCQCIRHLEFKMGDEENALPPSKKRVAGREISRDNPGLDDDESTEPEMGTFKKASEEVLAARRIVKVKRQQLASSGTAAPNPFANIQLVPPAPSTCNKNIVESDVSATEGSSENVVTVEKESNVGFSNGKDDEKVDSAEQKNLAVEEREESLTVEAGDIQKNLAEEDTEKSEKEPAAQEKDATADNEEATHEVVEEKSETTGKERKTESTAPLNSFQQLSSSQNAFTGLAGTGFSGSSFSFGSFPTNGSGFGGVSGSLFGQKSENSSSPSFGLGSSNNEISANNQGNSGPVMQEVPVETGEENENAIFAADAVLFEYVDGGWKERGKGEVKLNVSTSGTEKARLVMRARGNYRLILNASLYADMKLTNMDKRGITFPCANSAGEGKKSGLSTFALKFKDGSIVEQFRNEVEAHKSTKTVALRTPENSPKAYDE